MSERFGGKYSPETGNAADGNSYQGARRSRVGGRVNFLFLAPLPMIWQAFTSPPLEMFLWLMALADLLLAAWLTRSGQQAHEAYEARKIARRPALPRKSSAQFSLAQASPSRGMLALVPLKPCSLELWGLRSTSPPSALIHFQTRAWTEWINSKQTAWHVSSPRPKST